MKLKKRKRFGRFRGTRLCGKAAKKHKGSGNRGGKGMAGTGKRGDQRKSYVLKYMFPYFGKRGFTSKKKLKSKIKNTSLYEINRNIERYTKEGIAKKTAQGTEITLKNYKVLGDGEIKEKLIIKAYGFSNSAKEKIEKAGGKCEALKKEKA